MMNAIKLFVKSEKQYQHTCASLDSLGLRSFLLGEYKSTANWGITVFVDGEAIAGTTTPSGSWPDIPATSAVAIGGSQDGTLATNGIIDDVRIYDRVLSRAEIRLLSRRRGIAFTPRTRARGTPEQAAGGATPWLYARRRSQIIGAGGVH